MVMKMKFSIYHRYDFPSRMNKDIGTEHNGPNLGDTILRGYQYPAE